MLHCLSTGQTPGVNSCLTAIRPGFTALGQLVRTGYKPEIQPDTRRPRGHFSWVPSVLCKFLGLARARLQTACPRFDNYRYRARRYKYHDRFRPRGYGDNHCFRPRGYRHRDGFWVWRQWRCNGHQCRHQLFSKGSRMWPNNNAARAAGNRPGANQLAKRHGLPAASVRSPRCRAWPFYVGHDDHRGPVHDYT